MLNLLADWAEEKIFFWPISGTEFGHFWNWLVKSKFPGPGFTP